MANLSNINNKFLVTTGGNVLIGKTAANNATVGTQIMSTGDINPTVSGDTVARFNRLSNDGEIIRFQQDTTTDGAINSLSGRIAIGSGTTGIFFDSIRDVLTPHNMTTNAYSSSIDLGRSAIPFQNLYLSGQVNAAGATFAGVVTANDSIQVENDDSGFICRNSAGTVIGTVGAESSSTPNIGMFTVRNNGNNRIVLNANGNSYFNGGNVGIGTTSPDTLLHIYNPDTNWGAYSVITLGTDVEGTNQAQLKYYRGASTSTESFQLSVRGTTALTALYNGNVGIGVDPSGNTDRLQIDNPSNPTSIRIGDNTTDDCYIIFNTDGNDWSIGADRSDSNKFKISDYSRVGTNDRLTIDTSGNVGIGGSASTFANYTNFTIQGGSSGSNLDFKNSSGTRVAAIVSNPSSDFGIETNDATPILFKTNDTERMRITSGGNLQMKNDAFLSWYTGAGTEVENLGIEGSDATGTMKFYTEAVERMRITSGGSTVLHDGIDFTVNAPTHRGSLILAGASAPTNFGGIEFHTNSGGGAGYGTKIYSSDASWGVATRNNSVAFTTRFEISGSTGNSYFSRSLGIKTTTFAPTISTQLKLGDMESGAVGEVLDANVVDGAARMIICSGGATGQVPILSLRHYSAAYGIDIWMYYSSPWNTYIDNRHPSSGFIFRNNCNAAGGENVVFEIGGTGRINMYGLDAKGTTGSDVRFNTSTKELYYLTSSRRYKTDIVNLESTLDKINALRPVRFKDIKTGEDACGLIAEETFEIIPDVVFTKEIEGFDEPQIEGLNYSDIVPFLIKSIQELKAEIDELKK